MGGMSKKREGSQGLTVQEKIWVMDFLEGEGKKKRQFLVVGGGKMDRKGGNGYRNKTE